MKRFALAAVLVAAFGPAAGAQFGPNAPPAPGAAPTTGPNLATRPNEGLGRDLLPGPLPPWPSDIPPAGPIPSPVPPTPTYTGPAGPAFPYQKSGGLIVGTTGLYPYDSGAWLLGGSDGLTRQSGAFTMVYPNGNAEPPASYLPAYVPSGRTPLFKRKPFCR
jgi:hypothetical protein